MQHTPIHAAPLPAAPAATSIDDEILAAFEKVRRLRTTLYEADSGRFPLAPDEEDAIDAKALEAESGVTDNWARTPSGVAAQLMLAIPSLDQARWVDAGLMKYGILALYKVVHAVDGGARPLVIAAYELVHMEWDMALAAYEASASRFENTLKLKGFVEHHVNHLGETGGHIDPFFSILERRLNELEDRDCSHAAISRLIQTLTPDLTAYKRKVEIVQAEGYQTQAGASLVRDANFLFETIEHGSPIIPPAQEA